MLMEPYIFFILLFLRLFSIIILCQRVLLVPDTSSDKKDVTSDSSLAVSRVN